MDKLSKFSLIQSNKPSPRKRPGRLALPCCVTLHRNLNLGLPALCPSLGFQILSVPQIHYSFFDTRQGKFCFNLWWFEEVRKIWSLLTRNSLRYHSFSKNRDYRHLLFFFLYLLICFLLCDKENHQVMKRAQILESDRAELEPSLVPSVPEVLYVISLRMNLVCGGYCH